MSPDNGATKKFAYTNYKLSHDFETCTLPHSERVVTKFSKSNQRCEGNKKGVGPDENESEES